MNAKIFQNQLTDWYDPFTRPMPWKEERNPYKIWISEIILQQTRVSQGWKYYQNFIKKFPDVKTLAEASEDEVMKAWEGLGYYSRARNLHFSAKEILHSKNGEIPQKFESLISLKGIGPYTAAAILSFGFKKPYAIVDGNIQRLYCRIFGLALELNSTKSKKHIQEIADKFLDKRDPSKYNQAILDLSASICKPKNPNCEICPMKTWCIAFFSGDPTQFPIKKPRKQKQKRTLTYFLFEDPERVLIRKRNRNDIWQGLYEFILDEDKLKPIVLKNKVLESKSYWHQLTHQSLKIEINRIKLNNVDTVISEFGDKEIEAISKKRIPYLAFPKILSRYISEIY